MQEQRSGFTFAKPPLEAAVKRGEKTYTPPGGNSRIRYAIGAENLPMGLTPSSPNVQKSVVGGKDVFSYPIDR